MPPAPLYAFRLRRQGAQKCYTCEFYAYFHANIADDTLAIDATMLRR